MSASELKEALAAVDHKIQAACRKSGRNRDEVTLVAVSKRQPLQKMKLYELAAAELEIPVVFGESYVQELSKKSAALDATSNCHLIGPLQKNKVRAAVQVAAMIESIHTPEIAALVSSEALRLRKTMPVLLQVNISRDPAKSGFAEEQLINFLRAESAQLGGLEIRGLMTITELYTEPSAALPDFKALKALGDALSGQGLLPQSFDLSMGMSADYVFAIEAGATLIRVGTALFGDREKRFE
ncbi:MAG: YggS family pyridoxal phosphate-dependent enzyme [Oligoflexia bacterium]|nr:YggS family pyridoxal phosphate-dependent enzyme [Oligoflexia bacterium]